MYIVVLVYAFVCAWFDFVVVCFLLVCLVVCLLLAGCFTVGWWCLCSFACVLRSLVAGLLVYYAGFVVVWFCV